MRIVRLYSKKDFKKLKKEEMFDLWFRQALTDKHIAKLYGVTSQEVAEKRKALGLGNYLTCAMMGLSGPPNFRLKHPKMINIKAPKGWDPNSIIDTDEPDEIEETEVIVDYTAIKEENNTENTPEEHSEKTEIVEECVDSTEEEAKETETDYTDEVIFDYSDEVHKSRQLDKDTFNQIQEEVNRIINKNNVGK